MICNFGNIFKPWDSCSLILRVLGLVLDGNDFLETQARCLNQKEALNCAANKNSVSHFS